MKTPMLALATIAATMLCAATAPAVADSPKQGASMSYADLDLGTAAGRAELNQRFDQAARDKCGLAEGQKSTTKARYCYRTTGEQYRHYAEAVLAQHDRTEKDTGFGLAAR